MVTDNEATAHIYASPTIMIREKREFLHTHTHRGRGREGEKMKELIPPKRLRARKFLGLALFFWPWVHSIACVIHICR